MRSTFVAYWSVFQCISVYLLSAMCNVFAMYLDRICSASAAYLQHVFVVYCNVQCIVCAAVMCKTEANLQVPQKKISQVLVRKSN